MRLVLPLTLVGCAASGVDDPVDTGVPRVERDVDVEVRAQFEDTPFSCRTAATDLGTAGVQARPTDLRMFVHDLAWRWGDDETAPWTVTPDPDWVADGAVLLDYEDGLDACVGGTSGTNDTVRGRAELPEGLAVADLELTLGLPPDLNHAPLADSGPLGDAGVFLSTTTGRAHFQLDLDPVTADTAWPVRIVATGCTTPEGQPDACLAENTVRIRIPDVDVDAPAVVAAIDLLLRDVDLTRNAVTTLPGGGTIETLPGCQSTPNDGDCPTIFEAYGLGRSEAGWWRAAP